MGWLRCYPITNGHQLGRRLYPRGLVWLTGWRYLVVAAWVKEQEMARCILGDRLWVGDELNSLWRGSSALIDERCLGSVGLKGISSSVS